jgi:hypothetical protein
MQPPHQLIVDDQHAAEQLRAQDERLPISR